MPRGDRTGPEGEGAMTGRGAGACSGSDVPGYGSQVPGRGLGLGFGRRGGRGRGWRNRYQVMGVPAWSRAWDVPPVPAPDHGTAELRAHASYLAGCLEAVKARIEELTRSSSAEEDRRVG